MSMIVYGMEFENPNNWYFDKTNFMEFKNHSWSLMLLILVDEISRVWRV